MRGVVHRFGENQYLPEIPTSEAAIVLDGLRTRSLTIASAESCTGGLIASYFASVPEASTVFVGGIVAYDPDVKILRLDVPADVLDQDGAVSATVAAMMSRNVRPAMAADVGVAVTGNTGSSADGKPAGLTFIAVTDAAGATLTRCYTDDYGPGRNDERAVRMAFKLITDVLDGRTDDPHNV
jgi:nicotinamide-nucleotide amidase